jgi:hypothetical protein
MNPGGGENPVNFELPQPVPKEAVTDNGLEELPVRSPENKPEIQPIALSSDAASSMALPSQTIATTLTDDASTTSDNSQVAGYAKDSDRIEKVWIDKARTIINKTKDDPYEQKQQISRVKADYIKSRFSKTIKTDDPVVK